MRRVYPHTRGVRTAAYMQIASRKSRTMTHVFTAGIWIYIWANGSVGKKRYIRPAAPGAGPEVAILPPGPGGNALPLTPRCERPKRETRVRVCSVSVTLRKSSLRQPTYQRVLVDTRAKLPRVRRMPLCLTAGR